MSQINHLIESGAEKIVGGHQNFPQFLSGFHAHYFNFSGIPWGEFPVKTFCPWASLAFCRADYVLRLADYLLATWHPDTRPSELDLTADDTKWLGLEVKKHALQDDTHATVEFVARYRIAGKGYRLHELSRFVREDGRWYYVDGDMMGRRAD